MPPDLGLQLLALNRLSISELRDRYAALFSQATHSGNRTWLQKRLAWRLQALAEGDLSQRARQRAAELANDADLRLTPPRKAKTVLSQTIDGQSVKQRAVTSSCLPPPGTVLLRPYKGRTLQVRVLANGFAYEGQLYRSLSAVAKAITGSHCSGHLFFHLTTQGAAL